MFGLKNLSTMEDTPIKIIEAMREEDGFIIKEWRNQSCGMIENGAVLTLLLLEYLGMRHVLLPNG